MSSWLARRSFGPADVPPVAALKGCTVGLVVPALDEAPTIGALLQAVLGDPATRELLDEVVVVDGGSTDGTREIAAAAGVRVLDTSGAEGGKGGAVRQAVLHTTSDVLVVVDADLDPFDPAWVVALAAPLLLDDGVHLVKAASERPLLVDGILHPRSGGRVTELVARPLINALFPELAGVVQPLSGELAARRSLLETIPFATGYGLELGMLVDALRAVGLDGLAQVDLGERRHRHQSDLALGRMASAVLRTALARAGLPGLPDGLVQFTADGPVSTQVPLEELPPIAALRELSR